MSHVSLSFQLLSLSYPKVLSQSSLLDRECVTDEYNVTIACVSDAVDG